MKLDIGKPVRGRVYAQIRDRVWLWVDTQVHWHVRERVNTQVDTQVAGQVRVQVWKQLKKETV